MATNRAILRRFERGLADELGRGSADKIGRGSAAGKLGRGSAAGKLGRGSAGLSAEPDEGCFFVKPWCRLGTIAPDLVEA
ncbi:MAG: hypothetical protein WCK65_07370 [Rhodospirillaceae bacterium]